VIVITQPMYISCTMYISGNLYLYFNVTISNFMGDIGCEHIGFALN